MTCFDFPKLTLVFTFFPRYLQYLWGPPLSTWWWPWAMFLSKNQLWCILQYKRKDGEWSQSCSIKWGRQGIYSWKYRVKLTFQELCHPALFSSHSANSFNHVSTHQPELGSRLLKSWGHRARKHLPCTDWAHSCWRWDQTHAAREGWTPPSVMAGS